MRKLQPGLENVEYLKPAELRQIGFVIRLYPTLSEISCSSFQNSVSNHYWVT